MGKHTVKHTTFSLTIREPIPTKVKMATSLTSTSLPVLPKRTGLAKKTQARNVGQRAAVCKPVAKVELNKAAPVASLAATVASLVPAEHANAAQEVADLALGLSTNKTGAIATALFVLLPVALLVGLFVKSDSEQNVSGGFSASYYNERKKVKKGIQRGGSTELTAVFKGKGKDMY